MEKYYTIKDVSQRTGISAYTLRYYDKEGLLTFVKRSESGIRLFSQQDFEPLYTITCLKKSGMAIKDIKKFMQLYAQGNKTIQERYDLFVKQRQNLQQQIDQLQQMMDIVDYKCWYFKQALKYNDIDYYKKLPENKVDQRIKDFNQKVNDFRQGNN